MTAGLAVERRLLGHDLRFLALAHSARPVLAALRDVRHHRLPPPDALADETRAALVRRRALRREALRLAATRALLPHHAGEALSVDGQVLRPQDVLGEVEREAERIVEAEGDPAGKHPVRRQLRDLTLEEGEALVERLGEAALLAAYHLGDE